MGTVINIIFSVFTAMVGVICLGAGIIGYLLRKAPFHERLLLFAAAFLLIKPGVFTDVGGLLCVVVAVILQLKKPSTLGPGHATA